MTSDDAVEIWVGKASATGRSTVGTWRNGLIIKRCNQYFLDATLDGKPHTAGQGEARKCGLLEAQVEAGALEAAAAESPEPPDGKSSVEHFPVKPLPSEQETPCPELAQECLEQSETRGVFTGYELILVLCASLIAS